MSFSRNKLQLYWRLISTIFLLLFSIILPSSSFTEEGDDLLFFKYYNIGDPLSVFKNWNSSKNTCHDPCSWTGVTCGAEVAGLRTVIKLDLSNKCLSGSIPGQLGKIKHLRYLNLSNNLISGSIPDSVQELYDLEVLDLSHNDIWGNIPYSLGNLPSLRTLLLRNNHFTGQIPCGFRKIEVLDFSHNMISDFLPGSFSGENLSYLNFSGNWFFGELPDGFLEKTPVSAIVDLSFNNLTGEVTEPVAAKVDFLSGNIGLCGKLMNRSCTVPYTPSSTIPRCPNRAAPGTGAQQHAKSNVTVILITVTVIIAFVSIILLLCRVISRAPERMERRDRHREEYTCGTSSAISSKSCFRRKELSEIESLETKRFNSESVVEEAEDEEVVYIDGEIKLQLETLLKPPLDFIGSAPCNTIFRTVLENGTMLTVRRIEESNVNRLEVIKRVGDVEKLRYRNLHHLRGFYWDDNHKLFIYEYLPNGSLAKASYTEATPCRYQLPWRVRLKIARGVARGLAYLHKKKQVHGNLKPSNILLDQDMEPKISDYGLERLVLGGRSYSSSYDAPESSRSLNPNYKWDVYSFGAVLLELLTGRVLSHTDMAQWSTKHWREGYWYLRMVHLDIRSDVEGREDALITCFNIAFGCAALNPQKRPSMNEVVHVLENIPTPSSDEGIINAIHSSSSRTSSEI